MSANDHFQNIEVDKIGYNMGCLFDIPTGHYVTGSRGESILTGGIAAITGICGQGNSYKSTLSHFLSLTMLDRYSRSGSIIYDTEFTLSGRRLLDLAFNMPNLTGRDLFNEQRLLLINGKTGGGEFWDSLKKYGETRLRSKRTMLAKTPIVDRNGNPAYLPIPHGVEIDSLSAMNFESIENIQDKKSLDDKDQNTGDMRSNLFKHRLLIQSQAVADKYGFCFFMVAHMGKGIDIDPRAPKNKQLSFMRQDLKFKSVPEKFSFYTNNLYYCFNAKVYNNDYDDTTYYPMTPEDKVVGDTDLQRVMCQNLRAKSGPTGMPWELVISQEEGLMVGLSQYNYLKKNRMIKGKKYDIGLGISGKNNGLQYLDIYPDVKFQRTTIRTLLREDPKLARAMEITSEMAQIYLLWRRFQPKYICEPKDLYNELITQGYDWSVLLSTRGYWVFEDNDDPRPFLSTHDLLRMRLKEYRPFWMT